MLPNGLFLSPYSIKWVQIYTLGYYREIPVEKKLNSSLPELGITDMVGAVGERPTVELRFAGSIPAQNKYMYGLGRCSGCGCLWMWLFSVWKRIHDTRIIASVRQSLKTKKTQDDILSRTAQQVVPSVYYEVTRNHRRSDNSGRVWRLSL